MWVENDGTDAVASAVLALGGGDAHWRDVATRYRWRTNDTRCALRPYWPGDACHLLRSAGIRRVLVLGDSTQREFFYALSHFFHRRAGVVADDNATRDARARQREPWLRGETFRGKYRPGTFLPAITHENTSFVLRAQHQRSGGYTEGTRRRQLKGDAEVLSALFDERCIARDGSTHLLSVAWLRDELFVGSMLVREGQQCATWERTGWLEPGACAAAASSAPTDWGWISPHTGEVAMDWRSALLPRADLVVAQCGPHIPLNGHKALRQRIQADFVPAYEAAAAARPVPPLFLVRTSHLPVELCSRRHDLISELFAEQVDAQSTGAARSYSWPEILKVNDVFHNALAGLDHRLGRGARHRSCDAATGFVDVAQMTTTRPDFFEKPGQCMHMDPSESAGDKMHSWSVQILWNAVADLRPTPSSSGS